MVCRADVAGHQHCLLTSLLDITSGVLRVLILVKVRDQDIGTLAGEGNRDRSTDAAVAATAGEVRNNAAGNVSRTEFSSSTGGHTDGPSFTPVIDTGDDTATNPNHEWTASVPVADIQARHPQIGTLRSIGVLERNGFGSMGGRASVVQLVGTNGSVTLRGDGAIRGGLGLKSAWFRTVDVLLDITRIVGECVEEHLATGHTVDADLTLDAVLAADAWGRSRAAEIARAGA